MATPLTIQNKPQTLFIVAIGFFILCSMSSMAYITDGDTVYIDDSRAYISATPHTITGSGDVVIEFESKIASLNVTAVFGYNKSYLKATQLERYNPHNETTTYSYVCVGTFNYTTNPKQAWCIQNGSQVVFNHSYDGGNPANGTIWWNETTVKEWSVINRPVNVLNHNFDGKDKWYYIEDIPLQAGVRYRARVHIDAPYIPLGQTLAQAFPDYNGKYDVAFYPSSYGSNIAAAIADDKFYYLDPEINLTTGILYMYSADLDATTGSTAIDATGRGNATITGAYANATGKINSSYNLSGLNKYLTTTTSDDISSTNSQGLCLSFWYYGSTAIGGSNAPMASLTSNTAGLFFNGGQNKLIGFMSPGTYAEYVTEPDDFAGRWTHIVMVLNASATKTIAVYVNGTERASANKAAGNWTDGTIYFGYMSGYGTDTLGVFDEMKVFNKTCTADDVAAIYANESAGLQYTFEGGCLGCSSGGGINNLSVYWLQNLSNQSANHNGTPQILAVQLNASNASPDCILNAITSNNTAFPINNNSGWLNISGPNISRTGFYTIRATATDNCSNSAVQTFNLNITNTIPANTTPLISCANYSSGANCSLYCYASDPDNDNLTVNWRVVRNGSAYLSGSNNTTTGINLTLGNFTDNGNYNFTLFCNSTDTLQTSTQQSSTAITVINNALTIVTPVGSGYGRAINITYTGVVGISYYNITIYNATWNYTIRTNNSNNTSYYWANTYALNLSVNSNYTLRVTGYGNATGTFYNESEFSFITNGLLNVTARRYTGNTTINNVTVFTLNNTNTSDYNTTNATGSILFDIIKGNTYFITASPINFTIQNTTVTPTSNLTYAYTYHFVGNTFNITFYNETTNNAFTNRTVHFSVFSDLYASNFTTTSGNYSIASLAPGYYTFRYYLNNESTVQRDYYITLVESSYQNVRLYVLDEAISNVYNAVIIDESTTPISNATVSLLRYYVTNNSYAVVEMATSDTNGNAIFRVVPNTIPYKFLIYYNGNYYFTTPSKLIASSNTYTINLRSSPLTSFINLQFVYKNLTYNNATSTYNFEWADTTNTVIQGCLRVEQLSTSGNNVISDSCSNGASGSIIYTVTDTNNTKYRAIGKLVTNTEYSDSYTGWVVADYLTNGMASFGLVAVLIVLLLSVTIMFIGNESGVDTMVLTSIIGLFGMGALGLAVGSWAVLFPMVVLVVIIVYKTRT